MQVLKLDCSKKEKERSDSTEVTDDEKKDGVDSKLPKWERCPGETFYI